MKTWLHPLLYLLLLLPIDAFNQDCGNSAITTLQANQVKTVFSNAGDMFNDPGFENGLIVPYVPGGPELNTIFAAGLALAGKDAAGQLRVSFVSYRYENSRTDYQSGPLDDQTGLPLEGGCENFDQVWKTDRYDIVQLLSDFEDNNVIDGPIPESILQWPARGNAFFASQMGFELPDQDLAPFFDRNENGIYEPDQGEHPIVGEDMPGVIPDEIIWAVFNDVGNGHPNVAGFPLGAEVHLIAYAFNCADDEVLNKTIFTRHEVQLKGTEPLTEVMASIWLDQDLGCYTDDHLGFDTTLNALYIYNADNIDGENGCICPGGIATFCETPPASAVTLLNHDLYKGMTYNNGGVGSPPPATTDPNTAQEIHHLMNGRWIDGTPLTFGGSGYNPESEEFVDVPFFDNPNDPDGWSMQTTSLFPYDRRAFISISPRDLQQGEGFVIDAAYSFHRGEFADHLGNVDLMLEEVPGIKAKYDSQFSTLCTQTTYCEDDCVWPGDADQSGRVDKDDILEVGVGAGTFWPLAIYATR